MSTELWKDSDKWRARNIIKLGPRVNHFGEASELELHIETSRGVRGGIETTACCYCRGADKILTTVYPDDYRTRIMREAKRATRAAISDQHFRAMINFGIQVEAEARAFYERQNQQKAA